MALTSLEFLILLSIAAIVYYMLPVKLRFLPILTSNVFFLLNCNSYIQLIAWGVAVGIAYLIPIISEKVENSKAKQAFTYVGVTGVLLLMIVLRQLDIAPMGVSYYSLIYVAYMLDCYYGVCDSEKNILKFCAFAGFFPVITSGPIIKFKDAGDAITNGRRFEFRNIVWGMERILWGFVKKLIIADRISLFVDNVYNLPYVYNGIYIWIATAFFIIQLYMDFSGCIDIALGSAEIFGIKLPENFDNPFLSESVEEFWRKWHITLGGFLRDYVFYSILKSRLWQKMMLVTKKVFGKKYGKKIPTWLALVIVWTIIGFWHGKQANYIFGVGIWFGIIIVLSDALSPLFDKLNRVFKINTEAFSWKLFRMLRTWLAFGIGLLFFRAQGFRRALLLLKLSVSTFNPWVLFDESIYYPGLDVKDFHIIVFFLMIVSMASIVAYNKKKSIRELLEKQNLVFQWIVCVLLIIAVVVYGCYGVGFDSTSFIYQGF